MNFNCVYFVRLFCVSLDVILLFYWTSLAAFGFDILSCNVWETRTSVFLRKYLYVQKFIDTEHNTMIMTHEKNFLTCKNSLTEWFWKWMNIWTKRTKMICELICVEEDKKKQPNMTSFSCQSSIYSFYSLT